MKKCQILIITNGNARDSPVMLKFFQHFTKKRLNQILKQVQDDNHGL